MRRCRLVFALVVTVAIAAVLTGCGDQTAEANAAIEASNAAVDAANDYDQQASELFDRLSEIEPGPANTEEALGYIARSEELIAKKNAEVDKAIAELKKIESLEVGDELKTYAKQQIAIAELQKKSGELLLAANAEFKTVYEKMDSKSPDTKLLEASFENIETIFADADELSAEIERRSRESEAFFKESGLGK